jgi:hypothetical protein
MRLVPKPVGSARSAPAAPPATRASKHPAYPDAPIAVVGQCTGCIWGIACHCRKSGGAHTVVDTYFVAGGSSGGGLGRGLGGRVLVGPLVRALEVELCESPGGRAL